MLQHNWKCTLQSDLMFFYIFIVMFNCYLFHKSEAESLNTDSLTRLWKMSESGNRLTTPINKTNTQRFKSTFRNVDNDFIPIVPQQLENKNDKAQAVLPFFSELSTTYRTSSNGHNIDRSSTLKSFESNNESTIDSLNIQTYTTSKPFKSSNDSHDLKTLLSSKTRTPTTYRPSIQLNFRKILKLKTNGEYNDDTWNISERDSIVTSNPEGFIPRNIPVNIDKYSGSEGTARTSSIRPLTTTTNYMYMNNNQEEPFSKGLSKIKHQLNDSKYNATYFDRTSVPSVTTTSYDPSYKVTGRQINDESTPPYLSTPTTLQDIDEILPMDSARKSSIKKKYKKFMLPLLLAYKLKFFALLPLLMGGLVLLAGSTGMAGFFFALFAAVMGLKTNGDHH